MIGNLNSHMQKNVIGPLFIPYIKINSKWIKQ
jgi:hypothetical protein